MKPLEQLVRSNILALKPYSSARDEFEGNGEVFLDANENPFETGLNRYPDPYQRTLKKKIASIKRVSLGRIFLGNGSDEAIDLLFRIFCEPQKDGIIITDPTYGMYQVSASIQDIRVTKVPMSSDFRITAQDILEKVDDTTKMIFLCTPNNPTANDLDRQAIMNILHGFEGIVVIDEAYSDFTDQPSFTGVLNECPNLVILQTFSKAWGLAGIRLGMAFASEEIIRYFNKVKPPYNLDVLVQKEALRQLDSFDEMKGKVGEIITQREWLLNQLSALTIVLKVYPSSTNFLLVRFERSKEVFTYLMENDIIVRDRSKALHCENCLRITVGTAEENRKLLRTLNAYSNKKNEPKNEGTITR